MENGESEARDKIKTLAAVSFEINRQKLNVFDSFEGVSACVPKRELFENSENEIVTKRPKTHTCTVHTDTLTLTHNHEKALKLKFVCTIFHFFRFSVGVYLPMEFI